MLVGAAVQNGHPPPGDPAGPGGPFSLASPERNRELLEGAGFAEVAVEEIPDVMVFDDFEDYWSLQTQVAGPIALLVSSLPADAVEAIRRSLEPMVAPFRSGAGYEFPTLTLVATAA